MTQYMDALIELHRGVPRQGPGDSEFSQQLMNEMPQLPGSAPIGDLGCGSGVTTIPLAKTFERGVVGVDLSEAFLEELKDNAQQAGVAELVRPVCGDFGELDASSYKFSLIWSEGAAYALTFEGALEAWKPLLINHGLMVVSELSWLTDERTDDAQDFWDIAYPQLNDEQGNVETASRSGYDVLKTVRLPSRAWWDNYYNPVLQRADEMESRHAVGDNGGTSLSEIQTQVIADFRKETELFSKHSDEYGYVFYIMRKSS